MTNNREQNNQANPNQVNQNQNRNANRDIERENIGTGQKNNKLDQD